MPAICALEPIVDVETVFRAVKEALQAPWKIKAKDRRAIIDRMVQIVNSGEALHAIAACSLFLRMERSNREAAKLWSKLEQRYGSLDNLDIEALIRQFDAGEEPAVRAVAS